MWSESAMALYVPLGQYLWQSRTTTIIIFIVKLQISPSQTIDWKDLERLYIWDFGHLFIHLFVNMP